MATGQRPESERAVRVLKVGTAHPVTGPAIQDAVIVMRGEQIDAIGRDGEVPIPEGAELLEYPDAHAYPGLVDALSHAFGDAQLLDDKTSDAGTEIQRGLNPYDRTSRTLVRWGITTAYVSNRGDTTWRGLGTVVHPQSDGFARPRQREAAAPAVHMRISNGDASAHPLTRQKALRGVSQPFADLEAYRKAKQDHDKALKDYAEKYEAYLDYHRKKNGAPKSETAAEKTDAGETPTPPESGAPGRGGRRGGGRRRGERPPGEGGTPPATEGKTEQKTEQKAESTATPAEQGGAKKPEGGDKPPEKPPEKPKYPKAPPPDPAKDALIRVVDHDLTLRVEVDRIEDVRAALRIAKEYEIGSLVLEGAWHAAGAADEIAAAGVPVLTTGFLATSHTGDDDAQVADVPARLAAAGVEVAIGSGSNRAARHLPMLAAYAAGKGLDPAAAVAAITLTPAKILGLHKLVGSLEKGKRADVLVTSGPLLKSDTRILAVLSGGATQFEAQR